MEQTDFPHKIQKGRLCKMFGIKHDAVFCGDWPQKNFALPRYAISFAFLLLIILESNAQDSLTSSSEFPKAVFGVKAGVNVSSFSASINSESRAKAGPALGMYLRKQTGKRTFFRSELYYSNQGQQDNYVDPYGGPSIGSTTTSMHYINVPLLFEIGRTISFQLGPQIGLLVSSRERGTVESIAVNENLNEVMTTADVSIVVGAGFSTAEHFNCGVRVNYGVSNIYTPQDDSGYITDFPSVHNRVLHFYVAYSF